MKDNHTLKSIIEAVLFISGDGISPGEIARNLNEREDHIRMILDTLADDFHEREGGIMIKETSGKYRFVTVSGVFPFIQKFIGEKKKETLSKSMLEVLSIIAYKQPITSVEIDDIRGVNSRSLVTALVSRNLVRSMGQKEAPGRPTLYGTTKEFLEYFGIARLADLPSPKEVKEMDFNDL